MAQTKRGTAPRVKAQVTPIEAMQAERKKYHNLGLKVLKAHADAPYYPPGNWASWGVGARAMARIVESLEKIHAGESAQGNATMVWSTGTIRAGRDIRYPIFLNGEFDERKRMVTHAFYSNAWTSYGVVKGCVFNFDGWQLDKSLWGYTELADIGASHIHRLHHSSPKSDGIRTGRSEPEWENLHLAKLDGGLVNMFAEIARTYTTGYVFADEEKKSKVQATVPVKMWTSKHTTQDMRIGWYLNGVAPPRVVETTLAALAGRPATVVNLKEVLKA